MIPQIMILDGNSDDVNIELDEDTVIIHALEDVTLSLVSSAFPSGTLRFKAGQVIMLPILEEE